MISYLLSIGLIVLMIYAWLQVNSSRTLSSLLAITSIVGLVFVWAPDLTQNLAHFVGVGRGADLITYLWIVSSLFVSFNLHLEIRRERERFADLVRKLALDGQEKELSQRLP